MPNISNLVDKVIAYESGEMSNNEALEFFSELVKDGLAWTLQGCYGRMAHDLIQNEYLNVSGKILKRF
jgi:hypothetical protein